MLHGEIKVNDIVIAEWSAVNTEQNLGGDTAYLCNVKGRDNQGYPYEHQFAIWHTPSKGAPVLLWAIMQKLSNLGVR